MQTEYGELTSWGGLNPATYPWADSRGDHSIAVEASGFKLPSTRNTSSGGLLKKKYCLELVDYRDDSGANTWVKITRKDPSNKEIKSGNLALGMWNPYFDGKITKKSRAYYSFDGVGVVGKD